MGESIKEIKGWLIDLYTYAVPGFAFLVNLNFLAYGEGGKVYSSVFQQIGVTAPTNTHVLLLVLALSAIAGVLTMPLFSLVSQKIGQVIGKFWTRKLFSFDEKLFGYAKKHFETQLKEKDLDEDSVLNLVHGALVHAGGDAAKAIDEEMAKDAMFRNLGYTFTIFGLAFQIGNWSAIGNYSPWAIPEFLLGLTLIYLNNFRMTKHTTNLALEFFATRAKSGKAGRGQ